MTKIQTSSKRYFVTGIHTGIGKTVTSAFLRACLDAHYWKPIQAGDLDETDSDRVQYWSGAADHQIVPGTHALQTPASPHYAARVDGVEISLTDFTLPDHPEAPLIVEGAGGLLVPINEQETITDLIVHLELPVVLVSRHYLGSINHTMLSIDLLRRRGIPIAGLIYSGGNNPETVRIIEAQTGLAPLVELPELEEVTPEVIARLVDELGAIVRESLG
ncbi:dethiobiotin synthase [Lewinella sp. W8]|uniref:dethiobiotin synthase n=1 Tax=Lewinella sp. W8 TaxID=2528208 RepID=UPI001067A02D|nr:dethiobiotin synthase [Lewinella sp. W8]MTB49412.1 dethiobiotin synthase [Lewinella sp. W8]